MVNTKEEKTLCRLVSISDAESTSVDNTQDLGRPFFTTDSYIPKVPRDDPRVRPRFCHHGTTKKERKNPHFIFSFIIL